MVSKTGRRNMAFSLSHKWRGSFKPVVEAQREAVVGVYEDSLCTFKVEVCC